MKIHARTSSACARRVSHRWHSSAVDVGADSSRSSPPSSPPSPRSAAAAAAKLTNRRLIRIHGHDAPHFLQGLTTNNVRPPAQAGGGGGFYSAFLNAQGRVLHDVFVYAASGRGVGFGLGDGRSGSGRDAVSSGSGRDAESIGVQDATKEDPAYLIEVDAAQADALLRHLKRFRLRAKVEMGLVDEAECAVWSVWDDSDRWTMHTSPPPSTTPFAVSADGEDPVIGCIDARAPGMGRRLVLPASASASDALAPFQLVPLAAYTLRRVLRGVPEGQAEIPSAAALPQEWNVDLMGGIDFRKGCYLGQELTIRTHHTGVVRKRCLPVRLYGGGGVAGRLEEDGEALLPPAGANIVPVGGKGRSVGRWVGGVGSVGLALCRLEVMTDLVLTGEGGSRWKGEEEFEIRWEGGEDGREEVVKVKAFVPDWIRGQIKVRNPPKRVE